MTSQPRTHQLQVATIQEVGAVSSSDVAVAESSTNAAEAGRVSQEAVPVEQGQPLRAVEPDEWTMKMRALRAKPISGNAYTTTAKQSGAHTPTAGSLVSGMRVWKSDDAHQRRQDARDSGLDVASVDHCDISAEVGMFNKKLRFKVLVSHRSGAVAASEGPEDVTEHMVRFVLRHVGDVRFWCVSSSVKTSRQRSLCRTLLSGQGDSRQFRETRPGIRMAVWVTVNQPAKRWRNRFVQRWFQMYADYNCNSDKFPAELPRFSWRVRHAAWTLTRYALKADGRTSFFQVDEQGITTVRSRNSPNWFGFVLLPSSQSWRNSGEKLTGLESRNDLMNFRSRSEVRLVQPERFGEKPRDEQWNLEFVKAVLVRVLGSCECAQSSTHRSQGLKYITNQMLDQHGSNTALHKMLIGYRITFVQLSSAIRGHLDQGACRGKKFQSVLKRKLQIVLLTLYQLIQNVRVSEPVEPAAADGDQPAAMEVNTEPVVERAGGAAPEPDVSQAQPMEVSLEQLVTTGATKRTAETQTGVDGYIGGLRSFEGHQDVPNKRDVST